MNKIDRIKELIERLNEAAKAYYQESREIMSNLEYDRLYDELVQLEEETGIVLAGSPTQTVGYEAVDELPKEAHDKPMLSLAKTKSREELQGWLMDRKGLLSWKLDGLTIVLTYEEGRLSKAVTRGNGEVGEVITANAKCFKNVPLFIPHKGKLVLRGEAVISYSDFEKINAAISDEAMKYKNPRNLCSGSVRQLNSAITAERSVNFYAFALVQCEGRAFETREEQVMFLQTMGFATVPYKKVHKDNILKAIEEFAESVGVGKSTENVILLKEAVYCGDGDCKDGCTTGYFYRGKNVTEEDAMLELFGAKKTDAYDRTDIDTDVIYEASWSTNIIVETTDFKEGYIVEYEIIGVG